MIFLAALISEIAGTIAWFGSSSIFLPIVNQFFDFKTALLLVAIYHIFWNLTRFFLFHKHFDKKIFFLFWVPSIIFTVLWASLSNQINSNILKIILWIVLSLYASYSLFWRPLVLKPNRFVWIVGWGLSWFSAWLIWTWWVLRWAFMTLFWLSKESYIATIACVALLVDITRIPIYFWNWFLHSQYFYLIPILFLIAFIGSNIWKFLVQKIETTILRKLILSSIIFMSFLLAYQWFSKL